MWKEKHLLNRRQQYSLRKIEWISPRVNLELSFRGHILVKLEKVGEWNNEESIHNMKKESEVNSRRTISKIHRILNHKKIELMECAYTNASSLDTRTRNIIKEVVESCEICRENGRTKSRPIVGIPSTSDFNSVETIDLKEFGK